MSFSSLFGASKVGCDDSSDLGTAAYCKEHYPGLDSESNLEFEAMPATATKLCKDPNEVYTPKAPVPVVIKTTVQEICKDNQSDCLKNTYMYTNAMFPEFKEGCRKTCGLCTDPNDPTTTKPPRQDKSTGCEQKSPLRHLLQWLLKPILDKAARINQRNCRKFVELGW
ncbi:unnamed protein product [Caenorhabditis brenneri]